MANMELEGFDELIGELQKLGDKSRKIENKALRKAAQPIQKRMIQNVNRSDKDQIHTKDDIKIAIKTKSGIRYAEIGPKKTNWRAKFLEFGTSKMQPRPFVERSLDETSDQAVDILKTELVKELGL